MEFVCLRQYWALHPCRLTRWTLLGAVGRRSGRHRRSHGPALLAGCGGMAHVTRLEVGPQYLNFLMSVYELLNLISELLGDRGT